MCSFSCRYVLLWYERLCVCVGGGGGGVGVCVCDFIVILTLFFIFESKDVLLWTGKHQFPPR